MVALIQFMTVSYTSKSAFHDCTQHAGFYPTKRIVKICLHSSYTMHNSLHIETKDDLSLFIPCQKVLGCLSQKHPNLNQILVHPEGHKTLVGLIKPEPQEKG